jgi:hypothetical protein
MTSNGISMEGLSKKSTASIQSFVKTISVPAGHVPGRRHMPARPIFIGGTGSHVGTRAAVATALCRYLHRMAHRAAPFKAQTLVFLLD